MNLNNKEGVYVKKTLKKIWGFFEIIIIIYVIFMTLIFLSKNKFGYTEIGRKVFVSVDKNDIVKKVKKNDLLIITDNKKISKNNVTYYYSVSKDEYVVDSEKITYQNNSFFSNGVLITKDRIIGDRMFKIPLLGGFLKIVESKLGFLLLVFLPIFFVFIYQVYEFVLYLKFERNKMFSSSNKIDDEII